ncbi:hypothetical protein SNE40_022666 [Patella caerulea]|uniref:Uncharacterized protein n=1 Tax=Patella caerulea TaxID=87958 RepID=A0AAN8IXV6_PATCE
MASTDNNIKREQRNNSINSRLLYTVDESPPWQITIILGFQAFLTCLGSTFGYPILISSVLCLHTDKLGLAQLMGTSFFVAGIATLLQTSIGVRLPILQSSSFAYVAPIISMLSLDKWKCVYSDKSFNQTLLPEVGSDEHREMWIPRIREINGAIMVASILQIVIGFSGILGIMMRFIGPLTIAPTITLISLALFDFVYMKSELQWWITVMTVVLVTIFSQYLRNIRIPCFTLRRSRGCRRIDLPIFNLFPIIIAIGISWIICIILTATNVFSNDPDGWGYGARTDITSDVIAKADWFRFPYPGQWGTPTVSVSGVIGMMSGVFVSIIESIGDYYACARLSEAPPPPASAVSRGIGMEGISCLVAGAIGSPGGVTSYCENIGAIGITKVGSRLVLQAGGVILILLGCFTKFSAVLVSLPDPVIGGLFIVMFGMVVSVGISNLQFVDLNSSRNLFIFGVSVFCGLCIPKWLTLPRNRGVIKTGSEGVDQIITVLLSTSMFVAGLIAFVLDNTVPGTLEERGIIKWRESKKADDDHKSPSSDLTVYNLPFIQKFLDRQKWARYVPFLPNFDRQMATYEDEEQEQIPTDSQKEESV